MSILRGDPGSFLEKKKKRKKGKADIGSRILFGVVWSVVF
jgi:hypothetical protein